MNSEQNMSGKKKKVRERERMVGDPELPSQHPERSRVPGDTQPSSTTGQFGRFYLKDRQTDPGLPNH